MTRLLPIILVFLLGSFTFHSNEAFAEDEVARSIVKIYTIRNSPSYHNPWVMEGPSSATGSGCIISGGRILTNAHIVSNQTFVQVRKYGDSKRYKARVLNVSHEADLALLTVDDAGFFEGVKPLGIGELPEAQQEVFVYGFPLGGDTLSVTKGVISRIEHVTYAHSSAKFLAGQIDAAINPGNSGGPVVVGRKIVGVVMQSMVNAENIGYMVPSPIIAHFLSDIEDGSYDGFPSIGVKLQAMENDDLRRRFSMPEDKTGVLVVGTVNGSPSASKLRFGDIILEIDGYRVADDGTIEFRKRERTSLAYAIQERQIGEDLTLKILRDGKEMYTTLKLTRPFQKDFLIPQEQYDVLPTYYIYGGLVISPLTKNYLLSWGPAWYHSAPKELVAMLDDDFPSQEGEQVLIVIKVLASDVNRGYHDLSSWVISEVDGKKVKDINELVRTIEGGSGAFVEFKGKDGRIVVLDRQKVKEANPKILETYRVPSDRSIDIKPAT
ncbi:MAG: serine protease [Candidatus Methanosuratincola sp.]